MTVFLQRLTATFAAVVLASHVGASDNSLYAEVPPEDASFVRFVGFATGTGVRFGGKTFAVPSQNSEAYVAVSSALLENVPSGTYATVLRGADGAPEVILEKPREARSKVVLMLLNGTDEALDLRLADNSATVISAVAQHQSGQRGVNPVAVSLGVFAQGDTAPLATFDVALKRGQNLTFVAGQEGVRLIENRFGAVLK